MDEIPDRATASSANSSREQAPAATSVALVKLVVAVLVWRPGRGPAWPILVTVLLFVALGLQIEYGFALHIPNALLIFGAELAIVLWSPRPAGRRRTV